MRRLSCWYELEQLAALPRAEVMAMPASWRLAGCTVNTAAVDVYKKYTGAR